MHARRLAWVALLGITACGGLTTPDDGGKCPRGEATNVSITGEGAPGTMDTLCASGDRRSLKVAIDSGALSYFQIYAGNGLTQASDTTCADGEFEVDLVTRDSDSEWSTNYEGDSSLVSSGVSCSLHAGQMSSNRIHGSFSGRLLRSEFAGDGKRFLDVSFDFWIEAPEESEY